jgi:hypothetical protein
MNHKSGESGGSIFAASKPGSIAFLDSRAV